MPKEAREVADRTIANASAWRDRLTPALRWLLPAVLALPFLRAAVAIVGLPIDHDTPVMLYSGFLMERHGLIPYRDFFEMNAPGALYFYAAYYDAFGLSEDAYRAVHAGCIAAMLAGIVFWFRGLGLAAGLTAAMAYAIAYADMGAWCAFQRDFLVCSPLLFALLLALPGVGREAPSRRSSASFAARAFAIGLSFGAAATMKPPIALGFPVILLGLIASARNGSTRGALRERSTWIAIVAGGIGLGVIPASVAYDLARHGALGPFLDMARNYWPLYREIAGNGMLLSEVREGYLIEQTLQRVRDYPYLAASLAGGVAAGFVPSMRRRTVAVALLVLLGCAVAYTYAIYGSGKTWLYHAHPLFLVLSLLLGFVPGLALGSEAGWRGWLRAGVIVGVALSILATHTTLPTPPDREPARAIADHLTRELREGNTVLSLDVAVGALDAMLQAEARSASRFLYSFHFHHHVDEPYIVDLRAQWLREVDAERPRFVIRGRGGWQPRGRRGPPVFDELETRLARDYHRVAVHRDGRARSLELYERNARRAPENSGDPAAPRADREPATRPLERLRSPE